MSTSNQCLLESPQQTCIFLPPGLGQHGLEICKSRKNVVFILPMVSGIQENCFLWPLAMEAHIVSCVYSSSACVVCVTAYADSGESGAGTVRPALVAVNQPTVDAADKRPKVCYARHSSDYERCWLSVKQRLFHILRSWDSNHWQSPYTTMIGKVYVDW